MNLSNFAAEPVLVKLSITDPVLVEKYRTDSIDFWIYDRQDMETYMQLASMSGKENSFSDLAKLVKKLIFNADGTPVITGKVILPVDIMIRVIEETVKNLGNSQSQTLEAQSPA